MLAEAIAVKFRQVLALRERVDESDATAYQAELIRQLLLHARAHVPFYSDRLNAIDHGDSFDLDRWSNLPLVTRTDIQSNAQSLRAGAVPPFIGDLEESRTSGSTGRPLVFTKAEIQEVASAAQTDRVFDWWGLDGRKTLATFRSTYDESARGGTNDPRGWKLGVRGGMRQIIELMTDIDSQLDWLLSVKPDYVIARGGVHIAKLSRRSLERNLTIPLTAMFSLGSLVSEEARELARGAFKITIADFYGATETGLIAGQCPDCGLYHTCDETILVEVLRPDGSQCDDGEAGRIVVTPFYAYAMPFIRYEIGDYAVRGPRRAPCGRSLGSLHTITGRYRAAFVLRDGRVVQPYANATKIGAHLSYRQIQVVQTDYDRIEIRYVPGADAREANLVEIKKIMSQLLDTPVTVTLTPTDRIESGPYGKYEETLSLVPRPSGGG